MPPARLVEPKKREERVPGIMFIMGVSTSRKPLSSRKLRTNLMILVLVKNVGRTSSWLTMRSRYLG
jgi:hypothetical protein